MERSLPKRLGCRCRSRWRVLVRVLPLDGRVAQGHAQTATRLPHCPAAAETLSARLQEKKPVKDWVAEVLRAS